MGRTYEKILSDEDSKKIVNHLQEIKGLYQRVLKMDYLEKERQVVTYFNLLCESKEDFILLKQATDTVLKEYPEGRLSVWSDTNLIKELNALLPYPYRKVVPQEAFDVDMIIFKLFNLFIQEKFTDIKKIPMNQMETVIIDKLANAVTSTLVNNPNFKGENPYYKRHSYEYEQSLKMSLTFLNEDFSSYITYFNEDE